MIHDIVIQPVIPMRMTKLPRVYSLSSGKLYVLTPEDFEIHEYDNSKYITATNSKNPESYPIAYTEDITFNNSSFKPSSKLEGEGQQGMNNTQVFKFSYETKIEGNVEVGVTAVDQRKKKAHELFFGRHPMTLMNGKSHPGTRTAIFNVIDYTTMAIEKEISFDLKLDIANRIKGMEHEERADVCYYMGKNPKGMREGQLLSFLADPQTGLCTNAKLEKGQSISNMDRFINAFMKKTDSDTEMHIVIEKGISMGIFDNHKNGNLNSYYLGTSHVGNNVEEMISYFKKESKMYDDFVVGSVASKEDYSKEKKESKLVADNVKDGKVGGMSEIEIQSWRERALAIKKEGFIPNHINVKQMKIENLMPLVEKAEAEKKSKEPVV